MQQGDLIEIEITDLNHTGEGVGKYRGQVIFVPDTVIGDRIKTRITYIKKSHAIGKLQTILQASPHRIRPAASSPINVVAVNGNTSRINFSFRSKKSKYKRY